MIVPSAEQDRAKQRLPFEIERLANPPSKELLEIAIARPLIDGNNFQELPPTRRDGLTVAVLCDVETQCVVAIDEVLKSRLKNRLIEAARNVDDVGEVIAGRRIRA